MQTMEFKRLRGTELEQLRDALAANGEDGKTALRMGRDTSFVGSQKGINDEITDEEVITAIASVPCHY